MLTTILKELKRHAPFTASGALFGVVVMLLMVLLQIPRTWSSSIFWTLHPLHVVLSAQVTAGMYRLHGGRGFWTTILIGYFGSIGIATLSDSFIPFLGEWLLDLPHRGAHIGFIERWWLVNPLAFAGIAFASFWPRTRVPHAGHVLLSTWASLFHMTMALGDALDVLTLVVVPVFLFLAVWLPCCVSDIVFPLLFVKERDSAPAR